MCVPYLRCQTGEKILLLIFQTFVGQSNVFIFWDGFFLYFFHFVFFLSDRRTFLVLDCVDRYLHLGLIGYWEAEGGEYLQ